MSLLPRFPLGSLRRDCPDWPSVITGVTPGYGSQQFSDSYTPVAPLIHEVELSPFPFFCPACLHILAGAQCPPCSTPGYVWVVMTYRGPGRPRVGCLLCLLSFGSSMVFLNSDLFNGTCTGIGNVPHSLLSFLCILRLPQLCLTRAHTCHRVPFQFSSPSLGKGSSLKLPGVGPNVYILFCLCPHPMRRFEKPEKNLLLYLGLSPTCYLMQGVRISRD